LFDGFDQVTCEIKTLDLLQGDVAFPDPAKNAKNAQISGNSAENGAKIPNRLPPPVSEGFRKLIKSMLRAKPKKRIGVADVRVAARKLLSAACAAT
jgi:hypothetical protein